MLDYASKYGGTIIKAYALSAPPPGPLDPSLTLRYYLGPRDRVLNLQDRIL